MYSRVNKFLLKWADYKPVLLKTIKLNTLNRISNTEIMQYPEQSNKAGLCCYSIEFPVKRNVCHL